MMTLFLYFPIAVIVMELSKTCCSALVLRKPQSFAACTKDMKTKSLGLGACGTSFQL